MPNRPRSHQLEDLSIRHFSMNIPEHWVCREKGKDYGVDLEIEIFNDEGKSTGLIIYVQLKATDDPTKERIISLPVDRVRYLQSFQIPAILVRYCTDKNTLFWTWAFGALDTAKEDADSVTVHCDMQWHSETPSQLHQIALRLRRLRAANRSEKFPLKLIHNTCNAKTLQHVAAMRNICNELPFFSGSTSDNSELELTLTFNEDILRISLEPIGFLEVIITDKSNIETETVILYALAAVLARMGFNERAAFTARACSRRNHSLGVVPRELSFFACLALLTEPGSAVDLAIKNEFHYFSDWYSAAFLSALLRWDERGKEWESAVELFYREAIKETVNTGLNAGHLYYSIGNFMHNIGQISKAIYAFNTARKMRPEYNSSSYFLAELGGSLFMAGRHKCSARAYSASLKIDNNPNTQFCLGDAHLFAGEYEEAYAALSKIELSGEETFIAETTLKLYLAEWLKKNRSFHNPKNISAILEFSKLNENHNDIRFLSLLLAAFSAQNNPEIWAWAIHFSIIVCGKDDIKNVILCASIATGSDAYHEFRSRIMGLVDDDRLMNEIDDIYMQAQNTIMSLTKKPPKLRILYKDRTEIITSEGAAV